MSEDTQGKIKCDERLLDLVRYQRQELHQAELITDEEYIQLLQEEGSRKRLESYDELRERLTTLEANCKNLLDAAQSAHKELNEIHARCGVPYWDTGKSDVTQEYFTSVVENLRKAIERMEPVKP